MKTYLTGVVTLLLLAGLTAAAQEPPPEPIPFEPPTLDGEFDAGRPHWEAPPGGPGADEAAPGRRAHGWNRGGGGVDDWLRHVAEQDPAEFDRLQQLRKEDPHRFRKELRGRLVREQVRKKLMSDPDMKAFLESLPDEKRNALINRLAEPGSGPMRRHGGPPNQNKEAQELDRTVKQLVKTYRNAADADQDGLRDELRTALARQFDLRETERQKYLARLDEKLRKLKVSVDRRQANRDQIIDRRLQELTKGDPLAW